MKVRGKVCVVTGGGSGIGAALADELCARQAKAVLVSDFDYESAARVAAQLRLRHPAVAVESVPCDVTRERQIAELVAGAEARHGAVDVFVANAGVGGGFCGPDCTNEFGPWDQSLQVNTMHIIWAAKYVLPGMIRRGGGGFIVTASAAGLLSQVGSLPYTVTKHAAVAASEWLAFTYAAQNIKVTCLCPQAVDTPLIASMKDGGVAGLDGVLSAESVAGSAVSSFEAGQFLCLPHPTVAKYMKAKAADPQRWIAGMARLHHTTKGGRVAPRRAKL